MPNFELSLLLSSDVCKGSVVKLVSITPLVFVLVAEAVVAVTVPDVDIADALVM